MIIDKRRAESNEKIGGAREKKASAWARERHIVPAGWPSQGGRRPERQGRATPRRDSGPEHALRTV